MIAPATRLQDYLHTVYVPSRLEISDGAVEQIAVAVRQLSRYLGYSATLDDFSEDTLRQFLCIFRKDHAAATTNSRRRDLLALWQSAYDEGYVDRPPRRKRVPRAAMPPQIPEAWTVEEVARILQTAGQETGTVAGIPANNWWLSFLAVLYDTGERRGATLRVLSEDMDLSAGSIIFRQTKNGRPRICQLHPETVAACRAIYDPHRELLWPWPHSKNWLNKCARRIFERAGVRYGRGRGGVFHKFRRTSGSLVEQYGGDGAKHLGHSRAVFENHYRDPRICGDGQLKFLPRPKV